MKRHDNMPNLRGNREVPSFLIFSECDTLKGERWYQPENFFQGGYMDLINERWLLWKKKIGVDSHE